MAKQLIFAATKEVCRLQSTAEHSQVEFVYETLVFSEASAIGNSIFPSSDAIRREMRVQHTQEAPSLFTLGFCATW